MFTHRVAVAVVACAAFALGGCATDADDNADEETTGATSADITSDHALHFFRSPTGKLTCAFAAKGTLGGIPHDRVDCEWRDGDSRIGLAETGKATKYHRFDSMSGLGDHNIVAYGTTIKLGPHLSCASANTGFTCKSSVSGHGFKVADEAQSLF